MEERIHDAFVERATVESVMPLVYIGLRDVGGAVAPPSKHTTDEHFSIRLGSGLEDAFNVTPKSRIGSRLFAGKHIFTN